MKIIYKYIVEFLIKDVSCYTYIVTGFKKKKKNLFFFLLRFYKSYLIKFS